MPTEVFRHQLRRALIKHVRPPSKKDLGKKLRKFKPISTTRPVVDEMLSTSTGLPETDLASGMHEQLALRAPVVEPAHDVQLALRCYNKLQIARHEAHTRWLLRQHAKDLGDHGVRRVEVQPLDRHRLPVVAADQWA